MTTIVITQHAWGQGNSLERGTSEPLGVMATFSILVSVVVTQVYTLVKIH